MDYHLTCIHPFGNYYRGQKVTDADEIAKLLVDREHHFVRTAVTQLAFAGPTDEPVQSKPAAKQKS